jgi:hypothetical protein
MSTLLGGNQYATVAGFTSARLQFQLPGCRERLAECIAGWVRSRAARRPTSVSRRAGDEINSTLRSADHQQVHGPPAYLFEHCGELRALLVGQLPEPQGVPAAGCEPRHMPRQPGRPSHHIHYDEFSRQSMSLKSATVSCFGRLSAHHRYTTSGVDHLPFDSEGSS